MFHALREVGICIYQQTALYLDTIIYEYVVTSYMFLYYCASLQYGRGGIVVKPPRY
jgi:hypothetical protein